MARKQSVMGRRAQRRYARAVARRISSGKMRPKDQQFAYGVSLLSSFCQAAAQGLQQMSESIANYFRTMPRPSLIVLNSQGGPVSEMPCAHFSTERVELESIPSQAPG